MQVGSSAKVIAIVVAVILIVLCISVPTFLYAGARSKVSELEEKYSSAQLALVAAEETRKQQAKKIKDYAELSEKTQESLKNAKLEIENLSNDLRDNKRRLYVKANCPAMPGTDTARSVGNEGRAELTEAAKQDYIDLRRMIVETQQKVSYLQNYIKTQCIR